MLLKRKDRILIVGDLHFPYHNQKALNWVYKVIKQVQPTQIVQIGDLYDMYWCSKFPKKFVELTPKEEFSMGYKHAEKFWKKVKTIVPKARCLQILGNHDDRPMKRIIERFPEFESLVNLSNMYSFPGVKVVLNSKQETILRVNKTDVMFHHGYLSQLGQHMLYNQMRVVVGHSHKGGVLYRGRDTDIIWELNVGFLGDADAGPLQYGPQRRRHWTLGLGVIDELGPRFVPYE